MPILSSLQKRDRETNKSCIMEAINGLSLKQKRLNTCIVTVENQAVQWNPARLIITLLRPNEDVTVQLHSSAETPSRVS